MRRQKFKTSLGQVIQQPRTLPPTTNRVMALGRRALDDPCGPVNSLSPTDAQDVRIAAVVEKFLKRCTGALPLSTA